MNRQSCRVSHRWAFLVLWWAIVALGGCEPFPQHVDPLSVNGRDGGGPTPSFAALMRIGEAARAGGDYSNAVAIFRRAAEIEPRRPDPFVAIGDTLLAVGSVDQAVLAYNAALARDGGDLSALQGLATAYVETGRPELALALLDKAMKLNPVGRKLLVLSGVVMDIAGRHQEAQTYYRQGLQRVPGDPALTVDLALSLALAGDYAAAISTLQPIATAPAGTAPERQTLALIYGLQGSVEEAARLGRIDLDEASVEHNLSYYQTLRGLTPGDRDRAVWSASLPHRTPPPY